MHVRARPWSGVVPAFFALLSLFAAMRAAASPSLVGGGGIDYYQGPGGETSKSGLAIVGAVAGGTMGSLALARYLDNVAGNGLGVIGSLRVPLATNRTLCAWASRFAGDDSLVAWRIKAGPLFELPSGGNVGLYYTHAEDDAGGHSDAGAAELVLPLHAQLTGRASAAFGSAPGGLRSALGTVGLGWTPGHGVELTGDVGAARNGALVTAAGPPRGPLDRLLGNGGGGGGGKDTEQSRVDPLVQLGLRVLLP